MARPLAVTVLACLLMALPACLTAPSGPDYGRPLPDGAPALLPLGPGEPVPDVRWEYYGRADLVPALDRSLAWMDKASSRRFFPKEGVDHERARASLERFRELLQTSASADAFASAVDREFTFYKSAGWDGRGGGVLFTGYCTPILDGSLERDGEYRYPLYRLPPDLVKGEDGEILGQRTAAGGLRPYPTRRQIEDGHLLDGQELELVWLKDPVDAYIAHVNGSAVVRLPDGSLLRLGYAGKNGRPYASLRDALVAAGDLDPATAGLPAIRRWAASTPTPQVLAALERNDSYVFFTPIDGMPRGSLNVPVTARRTLATDKRLFPRGALVLVDTKLPRDGGGQRSFHQVLLDQDTGGAIRTAGRADIYLGVGEDAERLAGTTAAPGQLYYLFLRD